MTKETIVLEKFYQKGEKDSPVYILSHCRVGKHQTEYTLLRRVSAIFTGSDYRIGVERAVRDSFKREIKSETYDPKEIEGKIYELVLKAAQDYAQMHDWTIDDKVRGK